LRLDAFDKIISAGFISLLSDRIGKKLVSGGDTELCLAYRLAGYELTFNDNLTFQHELPNDRIGWGYLRSLFFGFGISKTMIDIYSHVLQGRIVPLNNGRFPFWFNRFWYLFKQLFPDFPFLFYALFNKMEGNDRLLRCLAKLGHATSIFNNRKQLLGMYKHVNSLKIRLASKNELTN
jgi:hypothetical protein